MRLLERLLAEQAKRDGNPAGHVPAVMSAQLAQFGGLGPHNTARVTGTQFVQRNEAPH